MLLISVPTICGAFCLSGINAICINGVVRLIHHRDTITITVRGNADIQLRMQALLLPSLDGGPPLRFIDTIGRVAIALR
jgi:hypothetical protein